MELSVLSGAHWSQCLDCSLQFFGHRNQFLDQLLVIEVFAVIQPSIPFLVAIIQESPLRCGEVHGVAQNLKGDIASLRAEAMPAERGQRKRMGCIAGENEAAIGGQPGIPGVGQLALCRPYQPVELDLVGRLCLELADFLQVLQLFLSG